MNDTGARRSETIGFVASTLMNRSSRLARMLASFGDRALSRTEAGLLLSLLQGPHRITELAESEALAQPTVTNLVDKLQRRGLVTRQRSPEDGRVVEVSISPEGRDTVEAYRTQARLLMRDTVEMLTEEELDTLVVASEIMEHLIGTLQKRRDRA
jgi:DNA-binding MarR family transcriptional regulator